MIVCALAASEILQDKGVAVVLHLPALSLKPAVLKTYENLLFHWMFLHISAWYADSIMTGRVS